MHPAVIAGAIAAVIVVVIIIVVLSMQVSTPTPAPISTPIIAPPTNTIDLPVSRTPAEPPKIQPPPVGLFPALNIRLPTKLFLCEDKIPGYTLSCPNGKIKVNDAKYGRFQAGSCPHPSPSANALCAGGDVTAKLAALCDGKSSCVLSNGNGLFGDTCPGIFKQLDANYNCM